MRHPVETQTPSPSEGHDSTRTVETSTRGVVEIGRMLDEAFACPVCRGSLLTRRATAWKGHGTGHRHSVQYEATRFEEVHPQRSCICVGGPVWDHILAMATPDERAALERAQRAWIEDGRPPELYLPRQDGAIMAYRLRTARELLSQLWETVYGARAARCASSP